MTAPQRLPGAVALSTSAEATYSLLRRAGLKRPSALGLAAGQPLPVSGLTLSITGSTSGYGITPPSTPAPTLQPYPLLVTNIKPYPFLGYATQTLDGDDAHMVDNDANTYAAVTPGTMPRVGWTFDLGKSYPSGTALFVPYYQDGRTYHDVKVESSLDGVSWATVFGPQEVNAGSSGFTVTVAAPFRVLRYTSTGSTANSGVHLVAVAIEALQ